MKRLTMIFNVDETKNPILIKIPNEDLAEMVRSVPFTLFGENVELANLKVEDVE